MLFAVVERVLFGDGVRWWSVVGELGDFDVRVVVEGGGDGGVEIRGNDEDGFVIGRGEAFAEFHRGEEVALPKKG